MTAEEAIKELKNRIYLYRKNWLGDHYEMERYLETYEMAIEALEKQIPKKPTEVDEREVGWIAFMCPACNTAVIGQPYRPNNCKHCGQAIDWSEGE